MPMRIAIVYNKTTSKYKEVLNSLQNALKPMNCETDTFDTDELRQGYDFVFVIGGDGTLLKTARFYSWSETPVMGINTGRLGFLSQSNSDDISRITEAVINNKYKVEERIMLQSDDKIALNDIVIKGASCSRTLKFYLKINDKFVCDYIADGLIVSTPTGSTAYGLSAGGPVLAPQLNALVIVPICPHTLTARPIVIPASEKITVTSSEGTMAIFTDGIDTGISVSSLDITASDKKAKLAFLNNEDFYLVLRNKLNWGVSPTNK